MSLKRKWSSLWVIVFFTMLTAVGVVTAWDYGQPCDEPAEQVILQENLKEYAYRLLGPESEAVQAFNKKGIQRISDSIERDHGESAYYLALPLLALADTAPDQLLGLWHVYTWLWFMVGVVSLYALSRSLGLGRVLACASALLLYLSPRFFAEGHYNNKDIVLLSLVLWTFASGARFLREPTVRRALLFSLAGALAANTKVVGAFAWGIIGLATLGNLFARKALTRPRVRAGVVAILSFLVFYAALTPAIWSDPWGYLSYVFKNASGFSRWTGVVVFDGARYEPAGGLLLPHRYLVTMMALTIPPPFLLLMALGQGYALVRCLRGDGRLALLLALTAFWVLPAAYVTLRQPILYNGWRHFYFLYAGLCAMGGLGLEALCKALENRLAVRKAAVAALSLLFLWQAVGIAQNHPYQYAYYNALAGRVTDRYELDYWDVSTVNAMRRLGEEKGSAGSPAVLGSLDEMSAFGLTNGVAVLSEADQARVAVTDNPDAPYLYANATYALIYGVEPTDQYRALFTLTSYGETIGTVYERTEAAP